MWFIFLTLAHLCAAFPLKCPEPAQWALRANGHCADPSKYFCLKNDLINGYSENCTRSDFQQPGRKAVLRGGIDADICSVERYQPFPIKFFTNVSTNCIFLKSFCNEEGQVVYDDGNRNTDTTCRCDYTRGYAFLLKPKNLCFCKPSQEDCSCYLKTCSNTSYTLSAAYQCIDETDLTMALQCKPITDEKYISSTRPEIKVNSPVENDIFILGQWNKLAATIAPVFLVLISGIMIVLFRTIIKTWIWRYCCRVYFVSDGAVDITLYEGHKFTLQYQTSRRLSDVKIYKDDTLITPAYTLFISNVNNENGGLYYAECHCIRSKYTLLTVLPLTCISPPAEMTGIEGEPVVLNYKLPADEILHSSELCFYKNKEIIGEPNKIVRHEDGVSFSLSLNYVTQEDNGVYFAKVNKFNSQKTKLTVYSMFTSELNLDSINLNSIIEGEKFKLQCSVYSENVDVKWLKNNVEIQQKDNISITKDGKYHHLTVQNSNVSDSGQYSIVAGNIHKEITVLVKGLFKRQLKDETIMEGLDISFECEVDKTYPAVWYKDDEELKPASRITNEKVDTSVYRLTIRKTTREDKGRYEIRINNLSSGAVLDVKEMPDVVKQMSTHDRSMFLKAAQSGTTVRYYIRVMIVGENGVGKTCLLRRLVNEDLKDVKSTDGINIEVKKCKIDLQKKKWIFASGNEFSSIGQYQNQQYADCGFWDFAGQMDFYATHQTFLSTNAIYLLVVDMLKDFTNAAHQDMVETEFKRTGEFTDFWLDNIHCYGLDDKKEASISQTDMLNPPVIIIGTKVEKIQIEEEKLEKKNSIINLLRGNSNFKHIREFYCLSNTEPLNYKTEFEKLRAEILKLAKTIPNWGDNLPTRWLLLERAIEKKVEDGGVIISYQKAVELAIVCTFQTREINSELESFLKYEHEIGRLIFFEDIKSYIILEPKWLVKVFKCFVSAPTFQYEFIYMAEWSHLKSTGILSRKLVAKFFEKEAILNSDKQTRQFALQIMEKFDIIVKLTTCLGNEEYYMPCMIMAFSFDSIIDKFKVRSNTCSRNSWFCLDFKFLPPAFFNHILVTFIKEYDLCIEKDGRRSLYRGFGIFDLDTSRCQKLIVCLSKNCVAMQVWEFHDGVQQMCHGNYSCIREHLITTVNSIRQRYRISIQYEENLKCSEAMFHEMDGKFSSDDIKNKKYCSHHHASHTRAELRKTWFEEEKEQKDNIPGKCYYCEKMHVNRCYECSNDLCDDCCLRHNEITETEYHTFQSSNDTMLLNNIYTVSDRIRDTKALPSGLLVTASDSREMLLTHNASDAHQNEINVFARPCSIAILDRNTVAVLVTQTYKKVESITIVDIRRRQVIQHVNMTPHLSCEQFRPMFCINDQLYTSGICQITVTDMSGTKVREIYLEFTPIDMCYDVKADRVYCIDYSGDRLWCIDRDGNTIFTLTEPSLLNSERLALDSEGYVLILCRADYDFKEFVVFRISPEGDSSEVIITGKQFDEFYSLSSCLSICFDVESDSVVIGIEDRLYFYKANRVN